MRSALWWLFYNLAQILLLPLLAGWLVVRKLVHGKGEGWSERLGASPRTPRDAARPVWIHAVSAGEAAAAGPIARALEDRRPDLPIVVSSLTPAGREMAARACPRARAVFYFPWDLLPCAVRSIRRVRPRAVLLMEAEFWPNFLGRCASLGIPVVVANGRISDRGQRRARSIRAAMPWIYSMVTEFGMQSAEDARRAVALGAPSDRVRVLGQTKFDQELGAVPDEEVRRLREEIGWTAGERVVVGGSTRPGEEAALLDALGALRPRIPTLRLILAPRHLERTGEVDSLARERGWKVGRRTTPGGGPDVLILDTMGELGSIYALGEVAFVGGTLADVGGHNLLQPIAQGKPVLFGPHTQNVRDIAALLLAEGVGFQVSDGAELTDRIGALIDDAPRRARLEAQALELIDAHRGASGRCVDLLLSAMGD